MEDPFAELTSGDDERAERSIPAIVALGEAALPRLLDLTRAPDADTRWWAVRALAASPHTRTSDLIPTLSDSSPEVRAASALALCGHPGGEAVEALVNLLADEDSLVAGLAGNALVRIGSPSVASLLEVMDARVEPGRNEASASVRIAALRALAEIRDHRAIPTMMKCLGEESAVLQYWAQEGLERLGLNMVYVKP
jgi:HEAT repeat protein